MHALRHVPARARARGDTGCAQRDIVMDSSSRKARDLAAFSDPRTANRISFEEQLEYATMIAPKLTIQGGTTEILRGIIARGLGLR